MSRKDVSDKLVLESYIAYENHDDKNCTDIKWPYEFLMEWTKQPEKVCYRAMERAYGKGYIEYGTSLRTGWLTDEGKEYLNTSPPNAGKVKGGE